MNLLKSIELEYWQKYLSTNPPNMPASDAFVSAGFAGAPEVTDQLLELYLSGKKTAGSSILEDYISSGDLPPKVGNYWIYLNSQNQPSCILKTVKIVTHKFKNVPVEIAIAEGEGDLSLDYWRKVHADVYSPFLADWGLENLEEATVITEFFEIVFRSRS